MKNCLNVLAAAMTLLIALPVFANDDAKPVRMGSGSMTFETVPGWGLRPGNARQNLQCNAVEVFHGIVQSPLGRLAEVEYCHGVRMGQTAG